MANNEPNEKPISSDSTGGETLDAIIGRRLSRRAFLKQAATGSAAMMIPAALAACSEPLSQAPTYTPEPPTEAPTEEPTEEPEPTKAPTEESEPTEAPTEEAEAVESDIGFEAIEPGTSDEIILPDGYSAAVLLRWGDPLTADAPEFDVQNQTAAAQAQQFGYNCDMVAFFPLPQGSDSSDSGILAVSHEYTNPDLMFEDYDFEAGPTKDQVDVELAAHGISIVEIKRGDDGTWTTDPASRYNRRLMAQGSPMTITGPVAGHDLLKTSADETGTLVDGTMNNCAGGKTPWGTFASAEENWHQYFSNLGQLADDDPVKAIHQRYGVPEEVSELQWGNHYDRFDVTKEPNEPFRFGWIVEVDPYDAASTPKKRTALGRFRHEAATFVVAPDNRVVAYSGDDERFEYVYKFVTEGTFDPDNRAANMDLLDAGTLYVAKFNDDGSGEWMPLVFGEGPLTEENGFTSQADVLIKTRLAADALEATRMDRPEDIETNPVNKKVYIMLTNNNKREAGDTNAANPRAENTTGHVIELTEKDDDHTATSFSWEILLLCGDPASDDSAYFADFDTKKVSKIACPDNCVFDNAGNLWIATDGQSNSININDGLFICPVEGPERGYVRQFFSSVAGSEVCGPEFTPDNTTLFLAIQHPGEGGTFAEPVSTWPDGQVPPRPSVITIQADDGRVIGAVA